MNSKVFTMFQRRAFSSLYNYSSASNPRVFMTVARGEQTLGDLVFELYADRQPQTTDNFRALCSGAEGKSLTGTDFHHGLSDFGISGGKLGEENLGVDGTRLSDEDLTVRHFKRGQLTAVNDGLNSAGSEFTITFGEARSLNGYQTCFGELVDGQSVLDALEAGVNRHGDVTEDFRIVASGDK